MPLLVPLALAQMVGAVPPHARAVTVLLCDAPDGCGLAREAMASHAAALGIPLLDFDDVAAAGPGAGEERAAWDRAVYLAREGRGGGWAAARDALRDTPLTVDADELFELWTSLALEQAEPGVVPTRALDAAAACSRGRLWDLPGMPEPVLAAYHAAATRADPPALLEVSADHGGARVYVDGLLIDPAPVKLSVRPGWHRVSVERPGRRTAWVGEIEVRPGEQVQVRAAVAEDDGLGPLEGGLLAAVAGAEAPPAVTRALARWAREQGLAWVRFVQVDRAGRARLANVPEERFEARDETWEVRAAWLDVAAGRVRTRGPGPATLRAQADPDRLGVAVSVGYARVAASTATGPDPHDHLTTELGAQVLLGGPVHLDVRVGLWHAAQPWYAYEDWLAYDVGAAAVGVGLRHAPTGLYASAQAMTVVPLAVGGQLVGGWAWRPTSRWRLGAEGKLGWTDVGPVFGGGFVLGYAG